MFPAGFLTVSVLIPFVVLATGWVVSCFGNLVLLIYFTWTAPNTLSNVTHGGVCKMTFISPFCQTCIHYCVIAYFLNRIAFPFLCFSWTQQAVCTVIVCLFFLSSSCPPSWHSAVSLSVWLADSLFLSLQSLCAHDFYLLRTPFAAPFSEMYNFAIKEKSRPELLNSVFRYFFIYLFIFFRGWRGDKVNSGCRSHF